jgi:UDP-N-acetylmuramate dehydrogenase
VECIVIVREHVEMGSRTTYRVGGIARWGLGIEGPHDAREASEWLTEHRVAPVVLGRGSNSVVADGELNLALVELVSEPSWDCEQVDGRFRITASSNWALPQLARRLADAGVGGFAWAVGVPGSLGGAVVMNAGGHGGDMAQCVESVQVMNLLTGEVEWREAAELHFAYRHSTLASHELVLACRLVLDAGDPGTLRHEMSEIVTWRREHQPGGRNAGSVFRNPAGDHAARLIESCGLKGWRLGGAEVSEKHANFIQATDGATAADVRQLVTFVQQRVAAETGVELHTEIKFVGFSEVS